MKRLSPASRHLFRSAAGVLSGSPLRQKLLVLIFHRVLEQPDPLNSDEPDARSFAVQLDVIGDMFNVLTVGEAAARLARGSLPRRALCITFDDGYRNNRQVAAPILSSRGLRATFFVSTGYLNGGRMWNDTVTEAIRRAPVDLDLTHLGLGRHLLADDAARLQLVSELLTRLKYLEHKERTRLADAIAASIGRDLPTDLMMTDTHVRELQAMGMEVGAHSVSHPILAGLESNEARKEIVESKAYLERLLDGPVTSFAYPNGKPGRDYSAEHPRMLREAGFLAAVSTAWGCCSATSDLFQLPRLNPWDKSADRYALRLLRSYLQTQAQVV